MVAAMALAMARRTCLLLLMQAAMASLVYQFNTEYAYVLQAFALPAPLSDYFVLFTILQL